METHHELPSALEPFANHRRVCAQLPVGFGLRRGVILIQGGGAIADVVGDLSYESCPAGTYEANLDCRICGDGTYSAVAGLSECTACPPGHVPSADRTKCEQCPIGTVAPTSGMSRCEACRLSDQRFMPTTGGSDCQSCAINTHTVIRLSDTTFECRAFCSEGRYPIFIEGVFTGDCADCPLVGSIALSLSHTLSVRVCTCRCV